MGGTRALLTVRDAGGKTLYVNTMECAQLYMALWKPVEMPMKSFPDEISQCASTIEAGLSGPAPALGRKASFPTQDGDTSLATA